MRKGGRAGSEMKGDARGVEAWKAEDDDKCA